MELEQEYDLEGDDQGDSEQKRPWDPRKIRVTTKNFSLRQICDEIGDGTIEIAPDFQRGFVWNPKQKTQLIESILLGIPLPAFYFNQDKLNNHQVVDGLQRLTTISTYAKDVFALASEELEYLDNLGGQRFSQLDPVAKKRFQQTQIVVHVIDAASPYELKFNIFKRINTGGAPLLPQEIRHCMARARAREALARMVKSEDFLRAVPLKNANRMEREELALRFVAFYKLVNGFGIDAYDSKQRFEDFLNDAMEALDDTLKISDSELQKILESFERSMTNCVNIFAEGVFRKNNARGRLNRALFDCWSVALSNLSEQEATNYRVALEQKAVEAMRDTEFLNAIGFAIANPDRIKTRFKKAMQVVAEGAPL
jgi:hypothetical protein